jgi:hypothetical protein
MPEPHASLDWSDWLPLQGAGHNRRVPRRPGLYRIRRVGREEVDYLGQTGTGGMTLPRRLAMLAGVYGEPMPYADPHTAGPALWALRHQTGCDFEVAVAVVEGTPSRRLGLEALAIALERQERGYSPTVNFGRMPAGYRKSTGNTARLVAAGLRRRGGPDVTRRDSGDTSMPPAGPLTEDVGGSGWCGQAWSGWTALGGAARAVGSDVSGLYRIRARGEEGLRYVGQGAIAERLAKHLATASAGGGARQAEAFGSAESLECSWVANAGWTARQRLELETDLIGAHVLTYGTAPPAQFLG